MDFINQLCLYYVTLNKNCSLYIFQRVYNNRKNPINVEKSFHKIENTQKNHKLTDDIAFNDWSQNETNINCGEKSDKFDYQILFATCNMRIIIYFSCNQPLKTEWGDNMILAIFQFYYHRIH